MEYNFEGNAFEQEAIGSIVKGVDGTDEYLHVRCLTADSDEATVERAVMQRYYRDTDTPGGYFCRNATVMRKRYSDNEYVVIVHHRYDN